MSLTDAKIRTAKPKEKPYKLTDERGMYLYVAPGGGKLWRFNYAFDGKQKTLALGPYPEISLADARERREEARKLLANGVDPGNIKKAQKAARLERAANSFEVLAREWYEKQTGTWSDSHGDRILRRFERDVFPLIGGLPVADCC